MFGQPVKSYGWSVTKHMTGLPPLRNHLWRKSEHPQRSVKKKKLGPWGPELIWQIATKYKMSRQNWPVIYVCVYVKKNVHACVCLHVCLCLHPCVCICMCWCLCRCVCMCLCICAWVYLWHAKYRFCIFGIHACHKKCKMWKWYYICVHVCPFVCVYLYCVGAVPNIK